MSRNRKRRSIGLDGPFVTHSLEMRRSPAWNALPDNARRVLDRLEVEHMAHGGAENDNLQVTFDDFVKAGVRRNSIALAVRQCEALGFVRIVRRGGLARGGQKVTSAYGLTYLVGRGKSPDPSHDWRKFATLEDANLAVAGAAQIDAENSFSRYRKRYSCAGSESDTEGPLSPVSKAVLMPGNGNATAFYISGRQPRRPALPATTRTSDGDEVCSAS
jgi:hypothetical protein